VDEVERWNIRWVLADDKPERLLDTLYVTNLDYKMQKKKKKKTLLVVCYPVLALKLISLPLSDPRRQGIWIFSSCQMGCPQGNSLCKFIL
jgi:hypothetical protein